MARYVSLGRIVIDEFSPFGDDGFTKISGLSVGANDFIINVYYNKTLVTASSVSLEIGEYGTTGSYWVQWIPNALGFWEIEIFTKKNKQYWYETYDVVITNDPGEAAQGIVDIRGTVVWNSSRDELVAMAWLNKQGEIVKIPGNCFWEFYDSNNNLLFTMSQLTMFSTGIYRAKFGNPGLNPEENYFYLVKIHDGVKIRESALGFITII